MKIQTMRIGLVQRGHHHHLVEYNSLVLDDDDILEFVTTIFWSQKQPEILA
jgi:hypothetical protein